MLADQTSAMDRVLGAMTDSVKERLAGAESKPVEADVRAQPPEVTDDAVADLLRRAGVDVEEEVEKPRRDARLVGHWLYDDIMPGGGMSTQIHLVLADDGSFRRYSESWGPAGHLRSSEERGEWHDENGNLVLSYDDDQESRRPYEFVRGGLFFPGSKWPRTWSPAR